MPYPDRQNAWPYDEQPSLSWGVKRAALIGLACVACVVGIVLAYTL